MTPPDTPLATLEAAARSTLAYLDYPKRAWTPARQAPDGTEAADVLVVGAGINGLAIACRDQGCGGRPYREDLEEKFARDIIGGPGSFVVTADGSTSFADAVRKKLVLEISDVPAAGVRLAEGRDGAEPKTVAGP